MSAKQLREIILMLRKERVSFTYLSVGGVTLDGVTDGKLERDVVKPEPTEPRPSMFARYGGELLKQPQAKPNEVIPDEALLG